MKKKLLPMLLVCIMLVGSTTAFAAAELFPDDVVTTTIGGTRQIVKTYELTADQDPADIPRESFERDGWEYTLTDITRQRSTGTERNDHTESITIETESNDLNAIIAQLAPTLEYASEDGFCGLLSLDLNSINCEEAGRKNSSYTVTATREYPHLSINDLSLIPKTITENGRTLELDTVTWEVQQSTTVDYEEIPESYRAVVTYACTAYSSKVTGYITTAEYSGEISRTVVGESTYTVFFTGKELAPGPVGKSQADLSLLPAVIAVMGLVGLLAAIAAYLRFHSNVKIYAIGENSSTLVAKDRISAKNLRIDLSMLDSGSGNNCFILEIERITAKRLNGKTLEVICGSAKLGHIIAFEGNTYKLEINFHNANIKAIY